MRLSEEPGAASHDHGHRKYPKDHEKALHGAAGLDTHAIDSNERCHNGDRHSFFRDGSAK